MFLLLHSNESYLSKEFLIEKGFESEAIKKWKLRDQVDSVEHNNTLFFNYKQIKETTKKGKNLPTLAILIKEQDKQSKVISIINALSKAYTFEFTQYLPLFENDATLITREKTEAAKLHAVWNCLFDMREKGNRNLKYQYEAFRKLYPEKYKGKSGLNSFSNALKKGKKNGIETLAFDRKKYGNNREENAKINKGALKYFITTFTADPQKFTRSEMLLMVNQAAKELGFPEVGLSWIKQKAALALKNILVFDSRYGSIETSKQLPHARFIAADSVHIQWQIDGMKPAFWGPKFESYSYVRVQDSYSRKIIGWAFGKTENKEVIVDAIRDAVNNTGHLPNEIVADNHSFNKSKEAANLQAVFAKKGSCWTITSNPRHKVIIERENQNFNKICKRYYGYLGEGIRSKNADAHPKDELKAEYQQNFLGEDEIKAIMLQATYDYNQTAKKNGKSANEMYAESCNPIAIVAGMWERAELLNLQTEKLIRSGQITFKIGTDKIEFQLPARLHETLNNTTVLVRYGNLRDGIYLFDLRNGEGIIDLIPKEAIHNAKANQTQEDIDILNKLSGRIKGIKSQAAKHLEHLTAAANSIDKDAYARASRLTTPKDVSKELEKSGLLQEAAERGIKTNLIDNTSKPVRQSIPALRPKEKKNTNPFTVKDNVIGKINSFT